MGRPFIVFCFEVLILRSFGGVNANGTRYEKRLLVAHWGYVRWGLRLRFEAEVAILAARFRQTVTYPAGSI